MSSIPPSLQADIERLQTLQAQLQNVLIMKQQVENELKEVERAISEIEKLPPDGKVYKIVGTYLVLITKEQALNELKERQELLKLNITSLSKQEALLRRQIDELRSRVTEALKSQTGSGTLKGGG